jgi:hypothetical protein
LIGTEGAMGNPKDYGALHYLDDSLLDQYSVPVKKLHHKTIFHLFSRVADIRGHKDNLSAAKKTPNKIWCKVSRECIKFQTFTKYQKTSKRIILRLKTNAQKQQKIESTNKNSSNLTNFSTPLKQVT